MLLPVLSAFIIGDALLKNDVFLSELIAKSLIDCVILFSQVFCIRPLPGVAPATVQTTHLIGIGTSEEDFPAGSQRKNVAFVLQQYLALFC